MMSPTPSPASSSKKPTKDLLSSPWCWECSKKPRESGAFWTAAESLCFRAGVGDREHASAEVFAIPHGNRTVGTCIIRHLHKAEAPGAAGLAISHDARRGDLACFGEGVAELITCRAVRKTADKEFACHDYEKQNYLLFYRKATLPDAKHGYNGDLLEHQKYSTSTQALQ